MKLYALSLYLIRFKLLIDLNLALSGQKARVQAITTSKQQRSVVIQLRLQSVKLTSGRESPPVGGEVSWSISRVLSWTIIHLRRTSPFA